MEAKNSAARRRFTLLDAVIVVAAIAVAILPAAELWPDVAPVAQRLEVSRIFEPRYVQEELFGGHMRSGHMATVRIQMVRMVNMALGLPNRRDRHIDYKTPKPAPEKAVQNWAGPMLRRARWGLRSRRMPSGCSFRSCSSGRSACCACGSFDRDRLGPRWCASQAGGRVWDRSRE